MTLRVCVAGATGWTGRPVAEAIIAAEDLELRSAVARSAAGRDLGEAWEGAANGIRIFSSVEDALDGVDVLVDYTSHSAAFANTMAAISGGVGVVVGSSGITGEQYAEIDGVARSSGVGVVAAGNFSLTAAMAQAAACLVARWLPHREVIDYASAGKPDAPSGTARELADKLSEIAPADPVFPVADTAGDVEARGATIGRTQVHSVRLPSFVVSTEVVFGLPDERLTIRHDAGGTAQPYVGGTLLAVRAIPGVTGLVRGLDTLLLSER